MSHKGTRVLVPLQLVLLSVCIVTVGAADGTHGADSEANTQQLREAARQQPYNPLAHVQLAVALHELNHHVPDGGSRVPEAEREYRKALELISPDGEHASIYMQVQGNLGALLLSADRPVEALKELQGALQLGQHLHQELQKQLQQLQQKGHGQQQHAAVQQHQQELDEIDKQLGGMLFNQGKALTSVGRLSEADDSYLKAAAAAYGHDFGSYGKALAAVRTLSPEAAQGALGVCQAATRHFESQPHLEFLKDMHQLTAAAIAEASEASATSQQAAAAAGSNTQPGEWFNRADGSDLVWLHFALYKYFHHGKQSDLAWHYLQLGNRIMAAHLSYDFPKEQRNFLQIKSIFRAPFPTSGLQDKTAIFIAGMPRSGSTLVEQILASHSQVFAAGEDTALAPLTPDINKALSKAAPEEHQEILRHFADKYLSTMRSKVPADWAAKQRQPKATSTSAAPARIADKMLRNLWLVGYIHMLLPNACIVHVVRHPMDVALSCYAQPFGYSAAALAWSWDMSAIASQLQMTWELAEHWAEQLPGRIHTVFYEELVERPESVAMQLLSACGLPWEPGVLSFHETDRPIQTASTEQVRQPLYKTSVQRWKAYRQQLEPLREELTPLIARYEQLLSERLASPAVSPTSTQGQQLGSETEEDVDSIKDEL